MSCHATSATPASAGGHDTLSQSRQILLVGRPNVGKSTLFNLLTGANQKTMNVARTTVSLEIGQWHLPSGPKVDIHDLPGTYSLIAQSPDEEVAANSVQQLALAGRPQDLAIVVLDATALASSLYLLAQVKQLGVPILAALTLVDVALDRGTTVDVVKLAAAIGVPVVAVNPRLRVGKNELGAAVENFSDLAQHAAASSKAVVLESAALEILDSDLDKSSVDLAQAERHFEWVTKVIAVAGVKQVSKRTRSDRIDTLLLRPIVGIPIFFFILWLVFQLTTTIASPIQDWFESLVSGPLTTGVLAVLGVFGAPHWLESVLTDGVLAGVGTVLSFVPLMVIIFTMIFILEDSGYLSRVAVVADRALQGIGLDGRAILPLVIGFGCNLPALSATKTIPNARQRLLTGLLIPFSSCTARLVIYLLLASAFFPNHAGTVVFLMYLASVLVIVLVGFGLRKTLFRDVTHQPLLLVLPAYQVPRFKALAMAVVVRCKSFILRAGAVILVLSVAVWALMAIPIAGGYSIADEEMPAQSSLFGATAHAISPAFELAGFNDWHASAALITGFVAKEAVVGTFATTYGVDEPGDPAIASDLSSRLRASFEKSSGGHGQAAAAAFMIFTLVYTPCLVTVAEQRRLFGGWVTTAAVVGSLILAWLLAVGVFQIAALLT